MELANVKLGSQRIFSLAPQSKEFDLADFVGTSLSWPTRITVDLHLNLMAAYALHT